MMSDEVQDLYQLTLDLLPGRYKHIMSINNMEKPAFGKTSPPALISFIQSNAYKQIRSVIYGSKLLMQ